MPGEMKEGQSRWLCVEISVDLTVDVVVMIIIRDPPIGASEIGGHRRHRHVMQPTKFKIVLVLSSFHYLAAKQHLQYNGQR